MMDREEILNLHTKTEEEQIDWLWKNNAILGEVDNRSYGKSYPTESLADCAFRMRDEMICREGDTEAMVTVYNLITERVNYESMHIWWSRHAKPIHWIQAALLAKLESEGEE